MSQLLRVVRAISGDIELIVPLFDAYRQFYQQPSDLAAARQYITERLSRDEAVIFLALYNEEAVGFTLLYPLFSSVSMRRNWLLNDLYVAPEARKFGVGSALLEQARHFAIETGAKELMLQTAVDNLTAQRVYERLGWQRDNNFYVYTLST